jgi:hypothetical protein
MAFNIDIAAAVKVSHIITAAIDKLNACADQKYNSISGNNIDEFLHKPAFQSCLAEFAITVASVAPHVVTIDVPKGTSEP